MAKPAHKSHTAHFSQLSSHDQARSISASLNNLQNAIVHHIENADEPEAARKKAISQLHRMLGRVLERTLLLVVTIFLVGCSGQSSAGSKEVEARAYLDGQLKAWASAEKPSDTMLAYATAGKKLIGYEVKSFENVPGIKEKYITYRAVVEVTTEGRRGVDTTQMDWDVVWEPEVGEWVIFILSKWGWDK